MMASTRPRSRSLLGSSKKWVDCLDTLTCAICLEIFEKPMVISCGHMFCNSCLNAYESMPDAQCPLCRSNFSPGRRKKACDVEKEISGSKSMCSGCSKKMSVSKLRSHHSSCSKLAKVARSLKFSPVARTSQPVPSDVPNRATFKCPFCGLMNLDLQGLTKHCNDKHSKNYSQVVCPICAAMPWGDPSLKSSNFIQHLNSRHRFEYDTYVDFSIDDEEALKAAIAASLKDL
ncbi:PREDICTED: RING finger protein 166-like [Priapulus caudatus]|uniref:RING finger protein 166-like n=1 Tax=Priapulus caudatus TaxID=37621 RepID=A0ABM1DV02_PRICU|nr:PREDICTED: RING finger protein 166-like [Priapulus caudatus]